jgi:NodT family efflux transporter outer membrane factor (OMF) lipoprotein
MLLTTAMTFTMSGCHIYKSYDRPKDLDVSNEYRTPQMDNLSVGSDENLGDWSWQKLFQDKYLQDLINRALERNSDVLSAMLRVDEAKALLTTARLAYLPSLNLAPQGTLSKVEGASMSKTYQLPVAASWEIDIFGRLQNANKAAKATLMQTEAYNQAVRSQIIAGVANSYYALLMLDKQLEISQSTAEIWSETVKTMEAYKEVGMTTEAALAQSRANYHQVLASIADLKDNINSVENAISVLLMDAPHTIERGTLEGTVMPQTLSVGVPLQLLANRPDVKAAEMTLANAYYTTNQARSAFYPQVTITGSAGWTNSLGSAIVNPGKLVLSAVGQLAQPIFNKGKLIANLKVTKAEEEIAKMSYQKAILSASKEVSDALSQYETANYKLEEHTAQVTELTKGIEYSKELFKSAQVTYLELLTAQQSLLSAQLNQVADKVQSIQSVISLYQALGGGRE